MRKAPSLLPVAAILAILSATPSPAPAETNYGSIAMNVARMLESHHYSQHAFDSTMSQRVLDGYLNMLDFNRTYFTQEDVDKFKANYAETLHNYIVTSNSIDPAFEIYDIYRERVQERIDLVNKTLKENKFDYASTDTITIKRDKLPWPKNKEEADQLWLKLIEADLLSERLSDIVKEEARLKKAEEKKARAAKDLAEGKKPAADKDKPAKDAAPEKVETPEQRVAKRYERLMEQIDENDKEDIANFFLSCIANAYDPHTEYMSPQETDNFRIQMNHSLVGIGALLQSSEDNLAEIHGIVVGGPADKQGELKLKDKILAVAQGEKGEYVDIKYMKLNKIVEMIRGKDGTVVRLKVVSADEPDINKEIAIVRGEVELKEKLANAELIVTPPLNGRSKKLGWIHLSSFYADMEGGTVSCSADVERLLRRLISEKIEGLIIDLRGDGGGSLEEAIKLTGLFIPKGPVVQSKDYRGNIQWRDSENDRPVYDGPLVVLTDKASASASEIFAAALQDYRRAVIVGEKSSFGKGTVQTIIPVERFMNSGLGMFSLNKPRAGHLKVTIQKFYRIAGGSTQLRGVVPDIILPSLRDVMEIGEDALPHALPYDTIPPRTFTFASKTPLPLKDLESRVKARITTNPEFQYISEDTTRLKERIDKNNISLNEKERLGEIRENKARIEARKETRKERVQQLAEAKTEPFINYRLNLDNVDEPGLTEESKFSEEDTTGMRVAAKNNDDDEDIAADDKKLLPYGIEPFKLESLYILSDLIDLGNGNSPQTANTSEAKKPAGL
jgi:carboxyl-terminal processing protease